MDYKDWLVQIGRSSRTANSYASAISGVISSWVKDTELCSKVLDDVHSVSELIKIEDDLKNVDIYVDRNRHGNNMYSCALKSFIEYRKCEASEEFEQDISDILSDNSITITEKTTYINARIGQGKYRNKLVGYWSRCALTGFNDVRFLVASHIKPWKYSNNEERLDPFNGLLLLPNIDKAFDLGFISFTEKGKILISDYLEESARLGIHQNMYVNFENSHLQYMKYHRDVIYESNI